MKFSYFQLGSGIRRPIIPLIVKANGKEVKYFALVDSGADLNLFHGEIAELLGIDLDSGAEGKISGITEGEAQNFCSPCYAQCWRLEFQYQSRIYAEAFKEWAWSPWSGWLL